MIKEKVILWFVKNRQYPTSPFEAEREAEKFCEEMGIK